MRASRNSRLAAEVRRSSEFRRGMETVGQTVKRSIERVAPRKTGDYAGSIRVIRVGDQLRVFTTDFAGPIIEFGSRNNPPYAPIRRGARAAGLRVQEHSK